MVDAINPEILTGKVEKTALNSTAKGITTPKVNLTMAPDTFTSSAAKGTEEAAKDTLGSTIKGSIPSIALFEIAPIKKLIKTGGALKNNALYQSVNNANIEAVKGLRAALKSGELTKVDKLKKIGEYIGQAKEARTALSSVKSAASNADKAIKLSEKMANASGLKLKFLNKKCAKYAAKGIEATESVGKGVQAIQAGSKAAEAGAKAVEAGAKATSKLGKAAKFLKSSGAGIMLVFSGAIELMTEVVPTFKELGAKKGLKQLGKSAIKVAADTAGFIGGEYAGTALGGAIGTAICPGIGTVVGSVVGFLGGLLGSFVAGKITKAIIGDSERAIAAKQQQQNQVKDKKFEKVA